ncbi:MAG: hypothetical protein K9J16_00145 [Melioribacteraceae bacterium]|nr:hypothetical protein [Melioribacteraceae bacterium]MCF8353919.1 hypothetical protein [Melioribacteraceae bacterium]MCF8392676.1 hypothetical protein [Melioribacteraceae bacterium]MCF8417697.1 hypothetical protein [Melioribacteraceae bacterium]
MRLIKLYIIIPFLLFFTIMSCDESTNEKSLKVGISPYQDIAMIVNYEHLDLERKYNMSLDLITMNWEDIIPAIASSGETIDLGFASIIEYLTKENNINNDTEDSLLFIYPAYLYKGGSFITFDESIQVLDKSNLTNKDVISNFLQYKIGAQKNSVYEMMLYSLARKNNISIKELKIYDTPLNDGLLATQNGSLDISSAGLTQLTEAKKRGGRVVLNMETMDFANDMMGFVCKKSTLQSREKEIKNFIKMWYECVDYVFKNLDENSKVSLEYLDEKAATKYTLSQYKSALSQEYFPKSIDEVNEVFISDTGKYYYKRVADDIIQYLLENNIVRARPKVPEFIKIK